MYTCTDHDYEVVTYTTWFWRITYVRCANPTCLYHERLGRRFKWRT